MINIPIHYNFKIIVFYLFTLIMAVLMFWIGEGGSPPWNTTVIITVSFSFLFSIFSFPKSFFLKIIIGFINLLFFCLTFYLGYKSFYSAFNDCIENGEEIRELLKVYHRKNNSYPDDLNQINHFNFCTRISRPTILKYHKTQTGYNLSFEDWLIQHKASESDPFMAFK